MPRRHHLATNSFLLVASILASFLLTEIAARYWLHNFASHPQISHYGTFEHILKTQTLLFSRHHYLQYVAARNYQKGENRHNDLGFRGNEVKSPKPEDVFRIVLLGGSTTYTASVPNYKYSYPYLLQKFLRKTGHHKVEVVNAGLHAYSSSESLINFQFRVLDLEPDLIIIYHGINDVHTRLVHPQSSYKGDNSGARVPYELPIEPIYDSSTVLRILRTRLGFRKPLGSLGFRRTFEYVADNYASQFRLQKVNGTYPLGIFRKVSAMQMLKNNPPIYFKRNLRNMIAIAKEHNIETALMTFAFSPEFKDWPHVSSPEYIKAMGEHNQVVRAICTSHRLPCYDFSQDMPTDKAYWNDGHHVNKLGAATKARFVSKWLTKSGLMP